MTIAGVVVTYNRKDELKKNIISISKQTKKLDKYIIVDNHGNDNTFEYLKQEGIWDDSYMEYIYLPENVGGAGGFCKGMQKAFEEGYDFVFLMDDDGRPLNETTIESIYRKGEYASKKSELVLMNSIVVCDSNATLLSFNLGEITNVDKAIAAADKHGLLANLVNPFNGTLVSRKLIESIGYPNEQFFIRGDEIDYNLRAKNANAYIATDVDSIYYHPQTRVYEFRILGRKCMGVKIGAPWKVYYQARNRVYSLRKNNLSHSVFKYIAVLTMSVFKYEDKKWESLIMLLRGIYDGMKGKLGKTIEPDSN